MVILIIFLHSFKILKIACYLEMNVDPVSEPEKQGLSKKKLTLTFEEYKRIKNMLVIYMRSEEEKRIAGICFFFLRFFSIVL